MDVTYNYWCTHSCNESKYIKVKKDESEKDVEEPCPECDKPMKKMGVVTNFWLGSFDSKSSDEKREILKKRERHYAKRDKQQIERRKAIDHGEIKS